MKFGDLIKGFSEGCGHKCIDFNALTKIVPNSPEFAKALVDAIIEVDHVYQSLYVLFLKVADECYNDDEEDNKAGKMPKTQTNDELVASIHNLYEFAVWNLICIEKITKKHDKRHEEKILLTVHKMVKNTFMYSNLADSELYKVLPKLEQSSATNGPDTDDFCSVCIEQVKCTIQLDCGHSFCLGCANSLSKHFFTNCPECRASVSPNPVSAIAKKILGQAPNPNFALLKLESKSNNNNNNNNHDHIQIDEYDDDGKAISCCGGYGMHLDCFANETNPDVLEVMKRLRKMVNQEELNIDFVTDVQHDGIGILGGVDESTRRNLMLWLRELCLFFCLSNGTYAMASSLVDRMLAATRVKIEHGDLAAMACLYIASKLDEPEDLQPTLRELSINSGGEFTERDIDRMTQIVQRKVTGPLAVIPFDFVDDILGLCRMLGAPDVVASAEFERVLIKRIVSCCGYYELLSFRPSTLALGVFVLQLQRVLPPTLQQQQQQQQQWQQQHQQHQQHEQNRVGETTPSPSPSPSSSTTALPTTALPTSTSVLLSSVLVSTKPASASPCASEFGNVCDTSSSNSIEVLIEKLRVTLDVREWDLDNCCRRLLATIDHNRVRRKKSPPVRSPSSSASLSSSSSSSCSISSPVAASKRLTTLTSTLSTPSSTTATSSTSTSTSSSIALSTSTTLISSMTSSSSSPASISIPTPILACSESDLLDKQQQQQQRHQYHHHQQKFDHVGRPVF